jgi:hypothetical protein
LFLHGVLNGFSVRQLRAISEKPMSLPPIVSETTSVLASSESNCGGLGPPISISCGLVMSSVVAPLQVGSRSERPMPGAARCA